MLGLDHDAVKPLSIECLPDTVIGSSSFNPGMSEDRFIKQLEHVRRDVPRNVEARFLSWERRLSRSSDPRTLLYRRLQQLLQRLVPSIGRKGPGERRREHTHVLAVMSFTQDMADLPRAAAKQSNESALAQGDPPMAPCVVSLRGGVVARIAASVYDEEHETCLGRSDVRAQVCRDPLVSALSCLIAAYTRRDDPIALFNCHAVTAEVDNANAIARAPTESTNRPV